LRSFFAGHLLRLQPLVEEWNLEPRLEPLIALYRDFHQRINQMGRYLYAKREETTSAKSTPVVPTADPVFPTVKGCSSHCQT
jgi:hypothetical protein